MIDVKRILERIQTNKKLQIIIGIVCLLLLIIIIKSGKKTKQYETQPIEKHTITQVVEASGTINPVNIVSVGSTVSGPISKIYVDYNSMVKKVNYLQKSILDYQNKLLNKIEQQSQVLKQTFEICKQMQK